MNWDAIAAIGQVLGSIAVFITLGYLAVQVRHARQQASRALSQGRNEALRGLAVMQMTDDYLAAVEKCSIALKAPTPRFVANIMQHAGLSFSEASKIYTVQFARWRLRLAVIGYVEDLTPIERQEFDRALALSYGGNDPISSMFFESVKPNTHPDARRYIDNVLAQPA